MTISYWRVSVHRLGWAGSVWFGMEHVAGFQVILLFGYVTPRLLGVDVALLPGVPQHVPRTTQHHLPAASEYSFFLGRL